MTFELLVLGTSAAQPAYGRHPSAQVLSIHNSKFLIDCGEGTQMQMAAFGVKRSKLNHIFITHLHGDHYFGLIGLLTSFALNSRTQDLTIFSPPGLDAIIKAHQLQFSESFPYSIQFVEVDTRRNSILMDNEQLQVRAFPLQHRIPTVGYRFDEKARKPKINSEKIIEFGLSIPQIKAIKSGEDLILEDGSVIPNADLTIPPPPPRSFAYCSDTLYFPSLAADVEGVDLLYHESTFCTDDLDRAVKTMHSTAAQAANLAKLAQAKQLILGHFSSRYPKTDCFEQEAKAIFPTTKVGLEGHIYKVPLQKTD